MFDIMYVYCSVTLTSSADGVCPGDTVVFTCVTDTGKLLWEIININNQYLFSNHVQQINMNVMEDIFILVLLNVTGTNNSIIWSTATAYHVPLYYSERNISCFDSDGRSPKTLTIKIGEKILYLSQDVLSYNFIHYIYSTSPISTT